MSQILDPATLRTETHTSLLETLRDWTSDPVILKALWSQGYGSPGEILRLGMRVKVTLDGRGEAGMSEREAARHLMIFLQSRNVRRVIAKRGKMETGAKEKTLLKELWEFKERLERDHGGRTT